MKIGIIGAGNIGGTLARKLVAKGHTVKIANSKGPETIAGLAREVGATAVLADEAVNDVEAVILSIPFGTYPKLADLFKDVPASVVVIDSSNYYPFRDGAIAEVDAGKPESVWVSEQLGRPVTKAWNAGLAATLADKGQPAGEAGRIALPVAGDEATAKAIAMKLVEETGFDAVDAGGLEASWRQQPGTPAYCTDLTTAELAAALQAADRSRAAENRDNLIKQFSETGKMPSHDEAIALNRAVTA
ncbi:3-hydroxyisobutyrate dehydrogenase [Sinorhizobium meliloti]|uniref:NADPH-dependent F420 reductase n=1 Tax=Rhizobium meliloti TaxID=382 RepID=UPI000B4A1FAB|nr:NAD(P)-binding domain-containing protein [Sinorhizobium meliloti]ASP98468.1 3-hydroxyisobutyrate dehydrogenase [Sinorhizobium meliloti]MQV66214.1 3-hydroxyisobutyrate dehydrogenase [Sinorhizobium meliloti]RVQ39300.1 3-hydroxyisobutyrate dehydrogenase [Sinorhizobium meliloti]